MEKIELLAPAGDFECLIAAIEAGANAIYLAGKSFGARGYANNFTDDELIEAINYAHIYNVKIYVTCNTLIYDSEVNNFIKYVEFLHFNNVDAIIIQDIGMLDLVHQLFPNLEIHISTQMHIHNLEGVKLVEMLGAKRVVLARETPLSTIKEIIKNSNIEIEAFIHGALCFSYSGQCLISSNIGSRSANRGLCASTCRLEYSLESTNKTLKNKCFPLSCKDLMTLENISQLIKSGIKSFKIEGRMKRKEYVFLTTSIYRNAIDNFFNGNKTNIEDDIKELKKIYNRQFTNGFINNNEDIVNENRPNHQGIPIGKVISITNNWLTIKLNDNVSINDGLRILNVKEDIGFILNNFYINKSLCKNAGAGNIITVPKKLNVNIGDIVIKTTDSKQLNEINEILRLNKRKIKLSIELTIKKGENIKATLYDGKNVLHINSSIVPSLAKTMPLDKEDIIKQLSKITNTPFEFEKFKINMDKNIFISNKELNNFKRKIIEQITDLRKYKINFIKSDYSRVVPEFIKKRNSYYLVEKITTVNNKNIIINKINNNTQYTMKLPRVINDFKPINSHVLISELGSLNFYKDFDTDFSLNVTNAYTLGLFHSLGAKKVTLSYELNYNQVKALIENYIKIYSKSPNTEVIVYGLKELMISKYNFYNKNKEKDLILKDRFGNDYKLIDNNDYMSIYDYKIFENKGNYFDIGVNNIRYNLEYINTINIRDSVLKVKNFDVI